MYLPFALQCQSPILWVLALSFFICSWAITCPVSAQQSGKYIINGKIIDISGNPAPGIAIGIENTSIGAISRLDGSFEIELNSAGKYTFQISGVGYETSSVTVSVNDKLTQLPEITLKESVDLLKEVVVRGKTTEQEKREEPIRVDVIDTKKLQVQSLSLPQVINQTSGVKVRQSGGVGSYVVINIYGLEGNAIRYFKDDIPLDYLGNAFNLSLLPIDQLDNIELNKCALHEKLGIDALGGGVNFITKPNLNNFIDASVSYGTFNTLCICT